MPAAALGCLGQGSMCVSLCVSVYVCVHTLYIIKEVHTSGVRLGVRGGREVERKCLFDKEKVVYSSAPSNVLTKCLLNPLLYFKKCDLYFLFVNQMF